MFFSGVQFAHSSILRMKPKFNCSWNAGFFMNKSFHPVRHSSLKFLSHSIESLQPSANLKTLCRSMNSAPPIYVLQLILMAPSFKVCPLLISSRCRFFRALFCSAPQRLALPQLRTSVLECASVVRPARKAALSPEYSHGDAQAHIASCARVQNRGAKFGGLGGTLRGGVIAEFCTVEARKGRAATTAQGARSSQLKRAFDFRSSKGLLPFAFNKALAARGVLQAWRAIYKARHGSPLAGNALQRVQRGGAALNL